MKRLSSFDYQIYILLHRQTRKNLAQKHYRNGKRKQSHIIRRDLTERLQRQTGASRQEVQEALIRIRDYLLFLE